MVGHIAQRGGHGGPMQLCVSVMGGGDEVVGSTHHSCGRAVGLVPQGRGCTAYGSGDPGGQHQKIGCSARVFGYTCHTEASD